MGSNVEMQDTPTIIIDDDEAVVDSERKRRNGEEIHCRDCFLMISKKGKPTPGRMRDPGGSFHPAWDRSLGNIEFEHQKLTVDAGCTPGRVLGNHVEDQIVHFLGCHLSPNPPSDSGNQTPMETKTSSMPTNYGFRCDDDQGLIPTRPETTSNHPEQPIEATEARPWTSPFQYDKLLAQGEIFEEKSSMGTKEVKENSQTERQILKHDKRLYQKASETKRALPS